MFSFWRSKPQLRPIFQKLLDRGVRVYIITRDPRKHDENLEVQAEGETAEFEIMGVQVLHRKVLWKDLIL